MILRVGQIPILCSDPSNIEDNCRSTMSMQGIAILVFLTALADVVHNLDYTDLQALGLACPERDKCAGYGFNRDYTDRSCECDRKCQANKDCCIDSIHRRSSVASTSTVCMRYGEQRHTGVYVIADCSIDWDGPQEVRQKCEGAPDFTDPLSAAPVTSTAQKRTYKNLFCAECNNVNLQTLKTFQFKLSCGGLDDWTQEQIMSGLFYNETIAGWGVNRQDANGMTDDFAKCLIFFDVPGYLNSSVRFCRANVISRCARNWTRELVRTRCGEYMAVMYDNYAAYRNPHCAICNHKTVADVSCMTSLTSKKKLITFGVFIDINPDSEIPVERRCPTNQKYDPFFKRCRKTVCALPSSHKVNGRCVPRGS